MSNAVEFGDIAKVESICMEILIEHGVNDPSDAYSTVTEMMSLPETLFGSPSLSELPNLYERSVAQNLQSLEERYEGFPSGIEIDDIERQILGAIGLGLEGKISGPLGVSRWITHAGRDDPPYFAADDLPETPLPTEAVPVKFFGEEDDTDPASVSPGAETESPTGPSVGFGGSAPDPQMGMADKVPDSDSTSTEEDDEESDEQTEEDEVVMRTIKTLKQRGYAEENIKDVVKDVFDE